MSEGTPFETPEEIGRRLAGQHGAITTAGGYLRFRRRLHKLKRNLRRVDRHLQADPARGTGSVRAIEWLLDNAYVVATAARQVASHLPRRFYRELPKLAAGPDPLHSRAEALAVATVLESNGVVDVERLRRLIDGYQAVATLNIGELWALPALLRLTLLEQVGELAGAAADRTAAGPGLHPAELETRIANRIRSLHRLDAADWKSFVESVSTVDRILGADPAAVFGRMDFDARDRYRQAIEELSRWSARSEVSVARSAVEAALSADPADSRRRHVGYHLIDQVGRKGLERRIGLRVPLRPRIARAARRHALGWYTGIIALLTAALAALVAILSDTPGAWAAPLALLPASTVAVGLVNRLVTHRTPPLVLPKLDTRHGLPDECPTVVVIPALLGSPDEIDRLLEQLEINVQGNLDPQVSYVLLADFRDAAEETTAADSGLLARAAAGVRRLNREYRNTRGSSFHLLHRGRQWNDAEGCWMGWERKRGKLVQLNRLLLGGSTEPGELQSIVGEPQRLQGTRFVITLDADTVLPPGTAARLVGAMAHPLNRPVFDAAGRVVAGYTVLQPRLEVAPSPGDDTLFARAFQGDTTLDLYSRAVSDVYQDLFGEGTFVGKAIYDVAAFERSLADRAPDNTLLSHDLFEGAHGRSGLVSDVVLLEDFPTNVLAHYRRVHRWARGDWQLLPWLLPWVPTADGRRVPNQLSGLNRWKMLDNLRRTLITPALVAMLLATWLAFPSDAWLWTGFALGVLATPILLGVLSWARDTVHGAAPRTTAAIALDRLRADAARWVLQTAFLAYDAGVRLDAVGRTLLRVCVTRRHLLEWTSAAHTNLALGHRRGALFWRRMGPAAAVAAGIGAALAASGSPALAAAAPVLLLWMMAPAIAWAASQPPKPAVAPAEKDLAAMRRIARRTWLFFETHLGPEQHWLMPDHVQDEPGMGPVHRTSPTNLGMALVAVVTAYDFGYLDRRRLAATLGTMLERMSQLERYRGHLLNWYDTRMPAPLEPRYVSTVDSGNLAIALLVVREACADAVSHRLLTAAQTDGLADTARAVREASTPEPGRAGRTIVAVNERLDQVVTEVAACAAIPTARYRLLDRLLLDWLPEVEAGLAASLEDRAGPTDLRPLHEALVWAQELRRHAEQQRDWLAALLPWSRLVAGPPAAIERPATATAWLELQAMLARPPGLADVGAFAEAAARILDRLDAQLASADVPADLRGEAEVWSRQVRAALRAGQSEAARLHQELGEIAALADEILRGMDFRFLFDRSRRLFRIGYDVSAGEPDPHHYDLLASEARLASLVAMAKGDVPTRHWLHLRRPLGRVRGRRIALSWGGTLFEFLMPALFVETPSRTLLGRSCHAVIRQHAAFGRAHGTPWGVSESAYGRRDAHGTYQYRAFGVPGTGLRRDLGDRVVIAPYASALALPFDTRGVLRNLARIEDLGGMGRFGLVEAIDFGRGNQRRHRGFVVRSYMAHHQGMVLAAISNAVHRDLLVRRVHRDARIASIAPLLHERAPRGAPIYRTRRRSLPPFQPEISAGLEGWAVDVDHPIPQIHLLSNGRYSVLVDASGGSGSRWRRDTALTRWRTDPVTDAWGQRIFLQDLASGEFGIIGRGDGGTVRFAPHLAEFVSGNAGLRLRTRLTVAPREDVELRVVGIRNESDRTRRIALTSYAEVALANAAEDRRHPAFTKLFVDARPVTELDALLFRRRPRSAKQSALHFGHGLVASTRLAAPVTWETDRARFLGPAGNADRPEALLRGGGLAGRVGAPLDPVCALRCEIVLPPDSSTDVAFVSAAAPTEGEVLTLLNAYRSISRIETAFTEAAAHRDLQLRETGSTTEELRAAQALFSAVVHPYHALRVGERQRRHLCQSQSALWAHGISGDLPLVAVSVDESGDLPLVLEVLRAQRHWRAGGARVDLVLIDEQTAGYDTPVRDAIQGAIEQVDEGLPSGEAGVFVVGAAQLAPDERAALECAARVFLVPDGRGLAQHLEPLRHRPPPLPRFVPIPSSPPGREPTPPLPRPIDLEFDNGLGGFAADGREYAIYRDAERRPPRRWVNVVANPRFGFLVSDTGDGYTWAENSAENRLTPWRNDPLRAPPGEALYLRDEETGTIWSPTPEPAGTGEPCLVRHGAGYTVFRHHAFGLEQELELFVHPNATVKIARLRLRNRWRRQRRLTATYFAEWVLGSVRDVTAPHVTVSHDAETEALFARCPFNETSGDRVAFLAASRPTHGYTADRAEFLGRQARWARPAGLERIGLSGSTGPALDPAAALQIHLDIGPGESTEAHFVLGQGTDYRDARRLAAEFRRPEAAQEAWESTHGTWRDLLDRVQVRTPDRALDLMLNHWLPYQALACRYLARTGLFQSSGAFGFRDQLQDVLAVQWLAPHVTRDHILEAARHQFREGDVLHWWHPVTERGVRTRCSDDLLWLPFAVAHYVDGTGDSEILAEREPFLEGPELEPGEAQRFERFATAAERGTVYEHCRRALDRAWSLGPHGLPLIGSGDWNDGYDSIGEGGRGESVWLAWFLYSTLRAFADLTARTGRPDDHRRFTDRAEQLRLAVERETWDGGWYLRAFFDDGTPLGSARSEECRIDSTAQTWGVISGAAAPDRAHAALEAVWNHLVRPDERLVLLLTPPFDRSDPDPGYIRGYPPGVRENGAQYTHAAAWVGWAFAQLGDGERAMEIFDLLNPIHHARTPESAARYGGEPYALAGDVLAAPPHVGRAGWTWYTGSAAWVYRLGIERILGIRRRGHSLDLDPKPPAAWPGFEATCRIDGTTYQIRVENPTRGGRQVEEVELDGRRVDGPRIPLASDGAIHQVRVRIGPGIPAGRSQADPDR